jgi:hypothetical protein
MGHILMHHSADQRVETCWERELLEVDAAKQIRLKRHRHGAMSVGCKGIDHVLECQVIVQSLRMFIVAV